MLLVVPLGCAQTRDANESLPQGGGTTGEGGAGSVGADADDDDDDDVSRGTGGDDDDDDDTGGSDGGLLLDVGSPDGPPGPTGCQGRPPGGDATLAGRVLAPNATLPISGALVYTTDGAPDGIPDHVYCEDCVDLPCDSPHTLTAADGTFALEVPEGAQYLVVQKGQFMRATEIDAAAGMNAIDIEATTLPSERNPAQLQWIPNIALGWGEYDRLENGLAKLGLGNTDDGTLVPGSERFDVWSNHGGYQTQPTTVVQGTFEDLLRDPEAMDAYHIIFVPCTSSPHASVLYEPEVIDNIRGWVEKGGKWYVADWSLEFLDRPFGQYQTWWEDDWTGGPFLDGFDTTGTVLDPELLAWLQALPPELQDINPLNPGGGHPTLGALPQVQLRDLWSTIESTPEVWSEDAEGNPVDVGHKTWIEGPGGGGDGAPANESWPLTVTGDYGCGRIMFTSYHTVEWTEHYEGLTPQELVLAYLILEIGVCQTVTLPPPAG